MRDLLEQFISLQPGLEVCGTATSAEEALGELPAGADLVTVDVSLGKSISGLELVKTIHERWPNLPCIVLSARPESQIGDAARDAGAAGYVEKGDEERLVKIIYDLLGIATGNAS